MVLKEELVDGPTLGRFSTSFCLCQNARFRPAKLYIPLRAVDIFEFVICERASNDRYLKKFIEIKYTINERCPPMEIWNNLGVRVYMETKKENKSLGMYPLCITVRDFDLECNISNSSTIVGLLCFFSGLSDYRMSNVVQLSSNCDKIGEVSRTMKLIDRPTSPAIVQYESIIITKHTSNVIEVGQVYQDKQIIVSAMKHYSVMNRFQFRVKRSSARSYCLVCVGDNYTWHFKSTSINESALFKIQKFNSLHTCSLMDNTYIQCRPTAMVVGSMVIPKYADPKTIYTPKDIQTNMLSEYGMNLTYMQACRAKEKTLKFLRGHPADSYSRLPSYLYILEKTYPGSVVKLQKTEDDCFLYAFVALSTSIKGWEYCRPVVVVDGTFLKSAYMRIMLTTSTMDAAGSILPLAYAVFDLENDASWTWFFEQFKHAYGEKPNMWVVSDQNESILKATSTVYTGMPYYACM
ncbi:uncharacterized protein LOC107803432 [Nicotiana tabacum]|uniref:Uncharacterized protein LOC107803432 n=1 Tax=Nicotiana tabacum TaxID=4097 RepID=A0A1S4B1A8_TOBAC|nr:PREDICTED: uncharacterized protein LOC107803432 [Nicotiana tabacum]